MTREQPDPRINTDAKIENDGGKRQPHERDESPDGQNQSPAGVMKQAASDLAQGLVDTDMHGMRGVEEVVPTSGSGQAQPNADAGSGMRHHEPTDLTKANDEGKNEGKDRA